jgi:hypothetical protein
MSDAFPLGQTPPPEHTAGSDEYNTVFERLSKAEPVSPVSAALAYSLYKQAKREWVTSIRVSAGRKPSDAELTAYAATQTDAVLKAFRANAESILKDYAVAAIDDARGGIVE